MIRFTHVFCFTSNELFLAYMKNIFRNFCLQSNDGVRKYDFKLPSCYEAKSLWKSSVEHHSFFRYFDISLNEVIS